MEIRGTDSFEGTVFRKFFETSPQPMWIYDPNDLSFLAVNRAACERYGYDEREFLRMTLRDIRPVEDLAIFADHISSARSGRTAADTGTWRHRTKSGEILHVEVLSNVVGSGGGGPIIAILRDVTAQHLLTREKEALLDLSDDVMLARDFEGKILWLNPAFTRVMGWSFQEAMSMDLVDLVHPDDRMSRNQSVERLKTFEGTQKWESRCLTKSGGHLWFEWYGTADRATQRIYMVGRDISESRSVRESLLRSETSLARAQSIAHVGSFSYDVAKNQFLLSDEYFRIIGRDPDNFESTWTNLLECIFPEDRHLINRGLGAGDWTVEPVEIEVRLQRPDGEIRTVISSTQAQLDEEGKPCRFDGVITDITQRKVVEHARMEAERANAAKSDFLSRMSHELRTPLNAILGFGQILANENLTTRQKDSVDHVLKGGRHLLHLINEILDIARVEAGKAEMSIEPISVVSIVLESCALIRPLASEMDVQLRNPPETLGEAFVLADAQRLKQVLINLLSNAIKYNRKGGFVEVSWHVEESLVRLRVADSGNGLTPEEIERLFVPFERLGAVRSGIEGSGLGLTISIRLVEAMNGRMWVTSTPGEGSIFTVELNRAANPEERHEEAVEIAHVMSPKPVHDRRYSILAIEDNISNLKLLEVIFESRPDISLFSAMQGGIGLDLAASCRPDLILLDLNLPDIGGMEILARLKSNTATDQIPVIVVSADATHSQIERLLAAGATSYLTKPLDIKEFFRTLNEALPKM